ncbi:MAG: type I polyketide synthase [Caldilineaceae bacterium]
MNGQKLEWQDEVLAQLQAGLISLEEAEQRLLNGPGSGSSASDREPQRTTPKAASLPPQRIETGDIAIIGMACRFPDADDWRALWANLKAGVDSIGEAPAGRWPAAEEWYDPDPAHPDTAYVRSGGFIQQVDTFDAPFFKISPAEAELMDPQQRIFLEEAYHAIEDAGLAPEQLKGRQCGVFVGAADGGYGQLLAEAGRVKGRYVITGLDSSILAARIAYFLDLQGPAVALNTACSTSLLAIHEACESIRAGEIELALAGASRYISRPCCTSKPASSKCSRPTVAVRPLMPGPMSFVPGEGCGVVLLKQATQALADGDPIHAIIKGSGINQDGSTNGITAPSMRSQARLEKGIYERFGINPATIGYVEAHGTGTALGDPIEINALTESFAAFTQQKQFCAIGSLKTNIGHTLMAAGVAGVIKAALCLKYGELPPSLHFQQPNPHIDFAKTPFYVNTRHQAWPASSDQPRRAAISSFGMSGTNAHLVLESAPLAPAHPPRAERPVHLLTMSAKSSELLVAYAQRYRDLLAAQPEVDLGDLCYTSHVGRSHFPHRLSFVTDSVATLQQQLTTYVASAEGVGISQGSVSTRPSQVAFLFTGQGAQYVQMGRELYDSSAIFRAALERCDQLLRPHLHRSILAVIYPDLKDSARPTAAPSIDDTTYTQPALFALEYALAQLWLAWGVQPHVLIGHSVGEVVAACVAGVFSLEDGVKLIAARGRLMGALPQDGAMVAVQTTEARVQAVLTAYTAETGRADVSIAAVNGPESIVISGARASVQTIAQQLAAEGSKTRPLNVSHAFHSPLMEPMLAQFRHVAATITYHAPQLRLISNVTGQVAGDEIATAEYWVRHVREAVRFAEGVTTLQAQGVAVYLEIGPKPVLVGMARQMQEGETGGQEDRKTRRQEDKKTEGNHSSSLLPLSLSSGLFLPSLRQGQSDWQQILTSLGELYVRGVAIDWQGFDRGEERRKVTLPTYPFQRQPYWVEARNPQPPASAAFSPLLGLVAEGKVAQVQEQLLATGKLTTEAQAALPAVLELLVAQHQQQQAAKELLSIHPNHTNAQDDTGEASASEPANTPQEWLYEVQWQPLFLPKETAKTLSLHGSWLIFADQQGMGEAVAKRIEENGGHAILVWPGTQVEATAVGWRINPLSSADLLHVLEEGLSAQPSLAGVVHLWSLDTGNRETLSLAQIEQTQVLGCGSVLALVQALAQTKQRPQLWLVTQQAVAVQGEQPNLDQATLWGLGGTVAQEYPDLHCVRLDVDSATLPLNANLLLQELLMADQPTPLKADRIAYRAGTRYAAQLNRFVTQAPLNDELVIHAQGTYLITGGTGGLGLQVARWLFEAGARHLVLTSRRGVTSATAQSVLQELEAAGAQVHVLLGDIADGDDVARILQTVERDLPPLRGIIHAAGVVEHVGLPDQQWPAFQRVMAPKVQGSWHLHSMTQQANLDFFVFFSSASSLLDTSGVSSYAAANAFLDAMAHYRRTAGLPALSINWGPWAEVGMAAALTQGSERSSGLALIEPRQGLQQLARLLKQPAVQVGVLPIDWPRYQYFLTDVTTAYFFARFLTTSKQSSQLQETLAAAPLNERSELVVAYVQKQVAQVLGFANPTSLPITAGLTDLGIDSLMAVELRNRLQISLGCTLPTTLIFDYPSVEAMAAYLTAGVLAPLLIETDEDDSISIIQTNAALPVTDGALQLSVVKGKNDLSLVPDDSEELSTAEVIALLAAKLGLETMANE